MKKFVNITLLTLSLCAVTSCVKDEPVDPIPQGNEITFATSQTRAKYSSLEDIKEGFGVYAVMSTKSDDELAPGEVVAYQHIISGTNSEGAKVWWDKSIGDDGGYTYANKAYWFDNRTYHFFGYWPYTTPAKSVSNGYELTFSTQTSVTNGNTEVADDDLLTFSYTTRYVETAPDRVTTVPVEFKHCLTKINLEISQDFDINKYDKFCVTSVKLTPVQGGGKYVVPGYGKEGEWHHENNISISRKYTDSDQFGDERDRKTLKVFDNIKLVPQEIKNETIGLEVEYTYEQGDLNNPPTGENKVAMKASTFLPIGEWKAGKVYTYKMVLYKNNIIELKNINIAPWGEQPDAGTIIIK